MDVQSAVRGLTQDFATAFNTGNYDQAAALFTADGFLMPPQHEAVQGQKADRVDAARDSEKPDTRTFAWKPFAWTSPAIWRSKLAATRWRSEQANGTTIADRGKFVQVWRRLGSLADDRELLEQRSAGGEIIDFTPAH